MGRVVAVRIDVVSEVKWERRSHPRRTPISYIILGMLKHLWTHKDSNISMHSCDSPKNHKYFRLNRIKR